MRILALDTSTGNLSLAVGEQSEILASANYPLRREMSQQILPTIDGFLENQHLSLKDIQGLAVGLGPGSFTSLRIGISTAKGLAFAENLPVIGVCSLDAIAHSVSIHDHPICVLVDAKRSMVYCGMFQWTDRGLQQIGEYRLTDIKKALESVNQFTVFIGDAVAMYETDIQETGCVQSVITETDKIFPQARSILELSLTRFEGDLADSAANLVPMYLYEEDCQVRK